MGLGATEKDREVSEQIPPTYEEFIAQRKSQTPVGHTLTVQSMPSYIQSGDVIENDSSMDAFRMVRFPSPELPARRQLWNRIVRALTWPLRVYYGWKVRRFFKKLGKRFELEKGASK